MVLIRSHWFLHTLNDERLFGRNLWFIVWRIFGWGYCLSIKAEAFFQTYRKVSAFESGTVTSQMSGFSKAWRIKLTVSGRFGPRINQNWRINDIANMILFPFQLLDSRSELILGFLLTCLFTSLQQPINKLSQALGKGFIPIPDLFLFQKLLYSGNKRFRIPILKLLTFFVRPT